jgi:MFS family permease
MSIAEPNSQTGTPQPKGRSFFLTTLPLFVIAHCFHHLLTAIPIPLLPFIRDEFNLSYTQSAFVTSSFSLANAFSQILGGWLADRVGPRILITLGILGVAVAGLLVGISRNYILMLVFLMLMGLVAGGYHPAATPLIASSVEPNQRGRALGIHLIGGNASFFLAPLVAGAIAAAWGWHASFIGLAIPTAMFGVIFVLFLSRRSVMSQNRAERGYLEEAPLAPGYKRRIAAMLAINVLAGGAAWSIMSFLPLYAVDQFGVSEQVAASLLSIIWSTGLWAGPVGGYISDRVGRAPVIVISFLVRGGLVFLLSYVSWGPQYIILLLFLGISNTLCLPVAEAFIIDQTTMRNRSTIYGIYYFTMGGTGAIFAPTMGQIIDKWGFQTCFTITGISVLAVTLISAFFLRGSQR